MVSYLPLWNIIDERWDKQLHRPLHAAGYFLNPQMHYRPGFKADLEVKRGLMECITRMVEDEDEQTLIMFKLMILENEQNVLDVPCLLGQLI